MPKIVVILHNIRSIHNVGSIFRTSEGFGVEKIILSGYTPYPLVTGDKRLPHIANALSKKINKTALGAELLVPFEYFSTPPLSEYKDLGYKIVGLEQDDNSTDLSIYAPQEKIVLLLGEEVEGLSIDLKQQCDVLLEIPMSGQKESFNVSVATGIALYRLTALP